MNPRKLCVILMLAGMALLLLSMVWFFVAYASTLDTMSRYGNKDVTLQLMACIYSTPPICQGAAFLGDGPSYSPMLFWLGLLLFIAGVIVFLALNKQVSQTSFDPKIGQSITSDKLLGFIAREKYTYYTYIIFLVGAGGGLLLPPLAIAALLGFVLAVLGYFLYAQQLTSLDKNHLAALSVVYLASTFLLFLTIGSALFIVIALAQLVLYYIGFNSYRLGHIINMNNLKEEAILAFKPIRERFSSGEKG